MPVIEHWAIRKCPDCEYVGRAQSCSGTRDEPHERVDTVEVEVVPAEQLRGAVEDRAVLRQMVEDIASQIAGEGMTGWADDIRADLHRLGGGQ